MVGQTFTFRQFKEATIYLKKTRQWKMNGKVLGQCGKTYKPNKVELYKTKNLMCT